MSGASAGVGAIASIRCLNDQTPSPCVRASSTTPRLVIISSFAVLTRHPEATTTKSTLP